MCFFPIVRTKRQKIVRAAQTRIKMHQKPYLHHKLYGMSYSKLSKHYLNCVAITVELMSGREIIKYAKIL